MKVKPVIRKSGKHWVIDSGPHKAMPCCETKAEAEQLLACSELWIGKQVSAQRHGSAEIICGRVVNTAVLHEGEILVDMLAVRQQKSTYWVPAKDCKEVGE